MLSILNSVRPDAKAMANYILQLIPEMREMFIPVNPFGSAKAAKQKKGRIAKVRLVSMKRADEFEILHFRHEIALA